MPNVDKARLDRPDPEMQVRFVPTGHPFLDDTTILLIDATLQKQQALAYTVYAAQCIAPYI
jgi:hypothetical protein